MDAAWVGVVGAVIGVLIGSGITLGYSVWRDRWERQERQKDRDEHYKQTLYPRRLEAHQQAFYLVRKIAAAMPDSLKLMKRSRTVTADEASRQLEEWWASNCFYLDEESRRRIIEAIVYAEDLVIDYTIQDDSTYRLDDDKRTSWHNDHREFRKCIQDTLISLEKGIGMKHVEKPKKKKQADKA